MENYTNNSHPCVWIDIQLCAESVRQPFLAMLICTKGDEFVKLPFGNNIIKNGTYEDVFRETFSGNESYI